MSEKTLFENVLQVLHHVQMNLHAPKNQYNSFGKYKYRSCEDILEGVKKVLPEGACVTICDEIVQIGDRIYVKATAALRFNDMLITNPAYAREEDSKKGMDAAQLTGATSSYARKYALNGLFLIDDVKDADTDEARQQADNKPAPKQAAKPKEANKPDFSALGQAITAAKDMDDLKKAFVKAVSAALSSGDKNAVDAFTKLKDDRKAELEATNV